MTRPARSLPGQTGWTSAAPVATIDLMRVDVEHAARGPGDDRRAGVDGHHLVAVRGVEDQDVLALGSGIGRRGQPARSPADDRDLDLPPLDLDVGPARCPRHVGLRDDGEWRVRALRVPDDLETRPAGGLARPHVGDTVHRREAVRAIAGEAQASRHRPGWSPPRNTASATESPGSKATGRPSTTIRLGSFALTERSRKLARAADRTGTPRSPCRTTPPGGSRVGA